MLPSRSGSFRLFRAAGTEVFLHWSWFLVAWYSLSTRAHFYSAWGWNVAEYLGLFGIVLLHEFGHVLACRQVGGISNEIVLWPFGGVAFGRPPPRPGAELWTVAAGPLVNVALWPILLLASAACAATGGAESQPDLMRLLLMLMVINKWLLIFNILPVYPLDGGQILRSLLWFQMGRARSLHLACSIGLIGIVSLAAYRLWTFPDSYVWTILFGFFLGSQCLAGLRHARSLMAVENLPRHRGFACPACHMPPPGGPLCLCPNCGNRFDAFSTRAICPHCQAALATVPCLHCGAANPIERWTGEAQPSARSEQKPYVDI